MRMVLNNGNLLLSHVPVGTTVELVGFGVDVRDHEFFRRLLEVGFLQGETLKVLSEAPYGKDPISVRVKDAVYAMRRSEAACIEVKLIKSAAKS